MKQDDSHKWNTNFNISKLSFVLNIIHDEKKRKLNEKNV